jgi:DNA-binding transcriptional regulator YiaG
MNKRNKQPAFEARNHAGATLARLRQRLKLSIPYCATVLGVSPRMLRYYETKDAKRSRELFAVLRFYASDRCAVN